MNYCPVNIERDLISRPVLHAARNPAPRVEGRFWARTLGAGITGRELMGRELLFPLNCSLYDTFVG